MTQDDVQQIEQALSRKLPRSLVHFLLNYPEELRTTGWSIEDDLGNTYTECPADMELCGTAEGIIALNRDNPAEYHYSAKLENWPESHLILGCNGCGGVYAINADIEDSSVYYAEPSSGFFDPEADGLDMYFDPFAESLEVFAQSLVEKYKKLQ